MTPKEKRCPMCMFTLPSSDFGRNRARRDGLNSYCKPCDKGYRYAYRRTAKRQEWQKRYGYNKRYGLTLEEVRALFAEGCQICGGFKNLRIDHDHAGFQGHRGVLCHRCNVGLPYVEDPVFLAKASEYLGAVR